MKYELFIAKRIGAIADKKHGVTKPIINIATGAIAISLIVMIISLATGQGLQKKIRDKVADFGGHIRITKFDLNRSIEQNPFDYNQEFLEEIRNNPEVESVQFTASKPGLIKTDEDFEGIILKGIMGDFNPNFFKEYLLEGSIPNFDLQRNDSIVVSKLLAQRLKLNIGDKVAMYFFNNAGSRPKVRALKIAGIYSSGLEDFDKNMVFASIGQLQSINKWENNEIGAIEVLLKDFSKLDQMDEWVYNMIGFSLSTQTVVELNPQLLQWVNLFDTNIMLIIVIMIAVGVVNISTALLIMILERTQMIGIMKALGSSNWEIRKIFIYKAFQLILKGLFIGNLIGLGFCLVQGYFGLIELDETSYYVKAVPIYINWTWMLFVNLGSILVCLVSMLLPSYLITRIKPIKAIRFD